MGELNLAVNRMLERREIFADLLNGTVYRGQQILKPEQLHLLSGQTGVTYEEEDGKKHTLERRGDVRMQAEFGTYSVIFANETQGKVHYAMPVRNMLYDALEYVKQVQELEKKHIEEGDKLDGDAFLSGITREDRLLPVINTVLYSGQIWDGEMSLYGMMGMEDAGTEEEREMFQMLREYLPDYRINVVCASGIETPEVFRSCLQHIFSMLKWRKDKKKLYDYVKTHKEEIRQMDGVETAAVAALLGEQKRLWKLLKMEKGEAPAMCEAIDELIEDGREEGRQEGRQEGQQEERKAGMQKLIETCQELGITRDTIADKLMEKYAVSEAEARQQLERYWKN